MPVTAEYWIDVLKSKPYKTKPAIAPAWYNSLLLLIAAHRGIAFLLTLAVAFGAYSFYRSEWSCAIRSCYVDVVRFQDFKGSTRVEGSRRYVDQLTMKYKYNFDRKFATFRAPISRNPVVRSLLGETVSTFGKKSIESTHPFISAKTITGTLAEFEIPVVDRQAFFTVEFSNDSAEGPDAIQVYADQPIRNLSVQITKPDDVTLVPRAGGFRESVLVDGHPLTGKDHCDVATDGVGFDCSDLALPASREFAYCFGAKGWNQPTEIPPATTEICKSLNN
jgi:hypothetical protein